MGKIALECKVCKYHHLLLYLINVLFFSIFKIRKMLLLHLPLGLWACSSARVAGISLLKACSCFDVCWPRRPRWHGAVEDEKSLSVSSEGWASEAELSQERHAAMLPSHSAPGNQAKYTAQRQETPGNGARLWSQIEKGRMSEALRMMASISSTPVKRGKKETFYYFSPICSIFKKKKKKTHHETHPLRF